MHHELFFALLGHTGDIVEAREDGFFVRADVSFMTAPQKTMIDRLLQLGHAFALLERFTVRAPRLKSLYVRGLAQGVELILREYTDTIVSLERKILSTRVVFPIPQMTYELEEYAELFPELCKLVTKIASDSDQGNEETQYVRGTPLLEMLHRMTRSGFPRLRKRMNELLHRCHRIMYKQILSWMLYGDVIDPFNEFFISVSNGGNTMGREGTMMEHDLTTPPSSSIEHHVWQMRFTINLDAIPLSYFPIPVAENILFIGKSVQILSQSNGFSPQESDEIVDTIDSLSCQHKFSAAALGDAVEKIRRHVAGRLYQEVVVKSEFVNHLRLLKDMFLLSRGELFQALIDRSGTLMAVKPTMRAQDELQHNVWSPTLRDLHLDEAPWIKNFSLSIPLQGLFFQNFSIIDGLILANIARDGSGKRLEVNDVTHDGGAVWWRHPQIDHHTFLSSYTLDITALRATTPLPRSPSSRSTTAGSCARAALLITKDDAFEAPILSTNFGGFTVGTPSRGAFATVELEFRIPPDGDGSSVFIISRAGVVAVGGSHEDIQVAPETGVSAADNILDVRVQYARVETRDSMTKKVLFQRSLIVEVNNIIVMDTRFDMTRVLGVGSDASGGSSTSVSDHFLGVALSPCIRLQHWRVDKFSPQATALPGSSLTEKNETLSAHECWNCLTLRCEQQWPLQLLVSKNLLRSYSKLFQFCFRIKRVAHALERTWKSACLRIRVSTLSGASAAACALRGRMSFVLHQLEVYFQVFVVDSCFSKCLADIDAASDFDAVKKIHEVYVAQLCRRFRLSTRALVVALGDVFRCCWDFVEYVMYQDGRATHGDASQTSLVRERVEILNENFQTKFACLFAVVQRLDLRDLVLLLDFNHYFSDQEQMKTGRTPRDLQTSTRLASSSVASSLLLRP